MKLKDKINTAEEYRITLEEKLRLEAYLEHITKLLRAYIYQAVSYTHLTLPTIHVECRSRWSPYH